MILYVEDNQAIGENVVEYLEAEGYSVDWILDGNTVMDQFDSKTYEIVILDVMLPGIEGFTLCSTIRKTSQIPIIMTTAKGMLDDKREGFEGGADDYLVKPFELAELVLRIEALLKRAGSDEYIAVGELEIYKEKNLILKNGLEIHLPLKERQLIMELVDARGMTVSRATIIDVIWGYESLFDSNDALLDVYVSNLRKKLGKKYIETVRGVGRRFVF